MSYKVEILYSPVYELLLSLSLYKRQTHLKYLDLGAKWPQEVEKSISQTLMETIKSKNSLYFEDLSVLLIMQCPVKESIDSFFQWMESLSSGRIYELLSPYLDNTKTVPADLASQSFRYVQLLSEWNEQYFQKVDKGIIKTLKADAEDKKKLLREVTPERIVRSASQFVIETDRINKVYLVPASHFRPMSLVDVFKDKMFITYPAKKESTDVEEVIEVVKALNDERRLRILRFLSKGSCTFTDIVKEIGMAKGNIHHHISILRTAKLLNIHLTNETNTFYYSTNTDFPNELKTKLDFLLK